MRYESIDGLKQAFFDKKLNELTLLRSFAVYDFFNKKPEVEYYIHIDKPDVSYVILSWDFAEMQIVIFNSEEQYLIEVDYKKDREVHDNVINLLTGKLCTKFIKENWC